MFILLFLNLIDTPLIYTQWELQYLQRKNNANNLDYVHAILSLS